MSATCTSDENENLLRHVQSRFGYVTFMDQLSAARAIETYNLRPYEGRRIIVSYAKATTVPGEGAKFPPSETLFVGNMPFDMSDQELNTLFREVKNVVDVRVAIDRRTGHPRGFAHADFIDKESAQKAMEYLSKRQCRGRTLRVNYGLSSKNSQRRQ